MSRAKTVPSPKLPGKGDKAYWVLIEQWAREYKSDGCTKSPDFGWCIRACWEHDYHFRFGVTVFGDPITFDQANTRMRQVIQMFSPIPRGFKWLSPASWLYWRFVTTAIGRAIWDSHRRTKLLQPIL